MDKKYFRIAQDNLYTELAVSLKIGTDEVKEYIAGKIEAAQEEPVSI